MSSSTVILPLERTRYFEDEDGSLATTKREDEIVSLTIDWTDMMASSETVSSATYEDSGVTTSGKSTTSTTTVCTVTGVGETEITVTTSASRVLQKVVRFYESLGRLVSDYR